MTDSTFEKAITLNSYIKDTTSIITFLSKHCSCIDRTALGNCLYNLRDFPEITDAIQKLRDRLISEFEKL